jgi:hypothetical protein
MNEQQIKNILKQVGLPLAIITLFFILAVIFYLYRNYLEAKKLNLEIIKLTQQNNGTAKCGTN